MMIGPIGILPWLLDMVVQEMCFFSLDHGSSNNKLGVEPKIGGVKPPKWMVSL